MGKGRAFIYRAYLHRSFTFCSPIARILAVNRREDLRVSSTTLQNSPAVPEKRELTTTPRFSDRVFRGVVTSGGLSSLLILGLILAFLAYEGYGTLKAQGIHFFTGSKWAATTGANGHVDFKASHFGIAAMLIGTLICATIAVLIGVPIAVMAAIYLTFYAPQAIRKLAVTVIDLMAAFPSILFGLWGYFILDPIGVYWAKLIHKYFNWIPIFQMPAGPYFDRSPLIAGLILAVMVIPIVTSISREIFAQTPLDRIQAAYALGGTKWAMIKNVAFPYARSGVVGGTMLALGRAMGETVAVYTVLNIVYSINWHILLGAGGNVASMILLQFGDASQEEVKALMAAGLVLFAMTLIVNSIANFIVNRSVKVRS
jgi:phosphate transport system permease protein